MVGLSQVLLDIEEDVSSYIHTLHMHIKIETRFVYNQVRYCQAKKLKC